MLDAAWVVIFDTLRPKFFRCRSCQEFLSAKGAIDTNPRSYRKMKTIHPIVVAAHQEANYFFEICRDAMSYNVCTRCHVVHKYIRCPMCGHIEPNSRLRCETCRKVVPLMPTCQHCGVPLDVTATTRRQRSDDETVTPQWQRSDWVPWRLKFKVLGCFLGFILVFVSLGLAGWWFELSILKYGGFGIAALPVFLLIEETVRLSWPNPRCRKCSARLRTRQAKQCFCCGHDWHSVA